MHPDIRNLLEVQKVDAELARLRRDLDSLPEEEQRRRRQLDRIAEESKTARHELNVAQVHSRESDVSIKGADEEIKRLEARLNVVKNNAEYQATLFRIEAVRRERDQVEEDGLALLDQLEGFAARAVEAARHFEAERAIFEEFLAAAEKLRVERSRECGEVGRGRERHTTVVSADLLRKYEDLFETRGGKAVSVVEGEVCTGCYTRVTPNDMARLMGESTIVQCNSCQRLLYLPDS